MCYGEGRERKRGKYPQVMRKERRQVLRERKTICHNQVSESEMKRGRNSSKDDEDCPIGLGRCCE